jgi:hypothetical protein
MSRTRTIANYSGGAIASNVSWVGPWIEVDDADSLGFIAVLTGTGAPVASWGCDVSNDPNASKKADNALIQAPTGLTLVAAQLAQNPVGDSANINFLFQFDPSPRAKWARFKYTRTSGGSGNPLLMVSMAQRGI